LANARGIEGLGVHDVEATASVHQHVGEALCVDDRVDHEWVPARAWDALRWSDRSKVMAESDHLRKVGVAGSAS
jgi:hypothetical protein